MRVYLTGRVAAEYGEIVLDERQFRSRQARLLFAYLVWNHSRPIPQDTLADLLWQDAMPSSWDGALKSLISGLRRFLQNLELDTEDASISSQFGCYQLDLPAGTWIDIEAAHNSVDEAEGKLRSGEIKGAWGPTDVSLSISRRDFLPGEDAPWVNSMRRDLQGLLVRALDSYSEIALKTDQPSLAIKMAEESLSVEPFRESSYQRLMRAHVATGNRAEALRVYQRCQELLSEELGVDPSPETEALYLELLRLPSQTN